MEWLGRTGGRLDTDLIRIESANEKGEVTEVTIREEEGGMRFTFEMEELMSLFSALNLCDQIVHFPMITSFTSPSLRVA